MDFACTRLFCLAKEGWENQVSYIITCHYSATPTRRLTKGIHEQTSCKHPYSETILIFLQKSLPEWVCLAIRSFSDNLYCCWIRVRGVSLGNIANGVEIQKHCLFALAPFSLVNYKMLGIPHFYSLFVCGKRLHSGRDFLSVVYRVLHSDNPGFITVIRWKNNNIHGAMLILVSYTWSMKWNMLCYLCCIWNRIIENEKITTLKKKII